ncbi:MAG: prepilin-type N-terminal cleavage/methylation domain-containing protein [Planctomycetota bacterium]
MNARTCRWSSCQAVLRPTIGGGFTLVELLVVVSIIALLISILLPSLKCAREQTKRAVCLANCKGIATASLVYAADDPTEAAIPVHPMLFNISLPDDMRRVLAAHAWGGKSGRGREEGDAFFWGTGRQKGPDTRPLNKFIYKDGFVNYALNPGPGFSNWKKDERLDLDMYRCPSDNGYQGIHWTSWKNSKLTSYDHYGTSYAANILWIFYTSGGGCGVQPCCISNAPMLRPLSRIPNPSNTLYYEENVGRYAFWADPTARGCGYTPEEGPVRGWHGCTDKTKDWLFNAAFADAHAGTVKMKGTQNPDIGEYPSGGWQNWRCVIIRGPGYQRDTLPSPPVPTLVPCSTARGDVE